MVDYSYNSEAQILILASVPAPPAATVSSVRWLAGGRHRGRSGEIMAIALRSLAVGLSR